MSVCLILHSISKNKTKQKASFFLLHKNKCNKEKNEIVNAAKPQLYYSR